MPLSTTTANPSKGIFIGMDEAGYGPNLGPLVIATTSWETPGRPNSCHFEELLAEVIDTSSTCDGLKLHVADSKQVNVGKNGFRSLEASALAMLRILNVDTQTFRSLRTTLCEQTEARDPLSEIPWFQEELTTPVEADPKLVDSFADRLRQSMDHSGLHLRHAHVRLIPAVRFNELLERHSSKGVLLSTLAFELLSTVWNRTDERPTIFVGDKHGGRNRYDEFLENIFGDKMIFRIEETRAISRYKIGNAELRFQMNGERYLPVAVASIIAKYLRELAMIQFNQFWNSHLPDLKPTKGYPTDAVRYRNSIKEMQAKLEIDTKTLWREK